MPEMIQPIMIAPGPAARDISLGRSKTPPPTIEPTTRAVSRSSDSLPAGFSKLLPAISVAAVTDVVPQNCRTVARMFEGQQWETPAGCCASNANIGLQPRYDSITASLLAAGVPLLLGRSLRRRWWVGTHAVDHLEIVGCVVVMQAQISGQPLGPCAQERPLRIGLTVQGQNLHQPHGAAIAQGAVLGRPQQPAVPAQ